MTLQSHTPRKTKALRQPAKEVLPPKPAAFKGKKLLPHHKPGDTTVETKAPVKPPVKATVKDQPKVKAPVEITESDYTVKDLAKEVDITPYRARKILRSINKAAGLGHHVKARWEWDNKEEFDKAVKAVKAAIGN